jgi:argininosuccinate lyase
MTMNPDHPPHEDLRSSDRSVFPDPTYKETVLRPLFEGAKAHHVDGFRRIDRAHLVMLAETGILKLDDAQAIARALVAIDREIDPATLVYTGEVEDFFFLIEAELRRRLGPDLAGRLHTGRSRNDIDHTLFKLALKSRIDDLAARLRGLAATLIEVAGRERDTLVVAYTHGQPAQPDTFGHYLAAIAECVLRDLERLAAARRIVDLSPMGAAAITTSGFPLDRQRMAQLLGFAAPLENSYGCIASVDYVTATYGAVELIFLHLGRPIQDLQFWTSFEVGQVYVPNAFVQISSIMPQKRNPVPIEHLRHLASQTVGRARAMLDVVHNTPFTDMNDSEGETQETGYGAFASAARVLDLLMALLPALQIDSRRVADNIRRSCITVTELADSLVRIEGLSFREAHEVAAAVARAVVARDGNLPTDGYEPFAASFLEATKRPSTIDSRHFAEIVSPEHFVAVRGRFGGPAPDALDASLARYRARLAELERDARSFAERQAASARELTERFAALSGEP